MVVLQHDPSEGELATNRPILFETHTAHFIRAASADLAAIADRDHARSPLSGDKRDCADSTTFDQRLRRTLLVLAPLALVAN
jgi:hypothetical protein